MRVEHRESRGQSSVKEVLPKRLREESKEDLRDVSKRVVRWEEGDIPITVKKTDYGVLLMFEDSVSQCK